MALHGFADFATPVGVRRLVRGLGLLATATLVAAAAQAAEIRLLSAGAVELGLVPVLAAFERDTGHRVSVVYSAAPPFAARFAAGPAFDGVIAPPAALEALTTSGALGRERVPVGKVGIGVAVRNGAAAPDIASVDALRRALLDADTVVFNRASTGLYVEKLIVQLGIAEAVDAKASRHDDGASVMRRLLAGTKPREIGLAAMTEVVLFRDQGVRLVGPLPVAVQNTTRYVAAPAAPAGATEDRAEATSALLRTLAAAPARAIFAAAGIEPVD